MQTRVVLRKVIHRLKQLFIFYKKFCVYGCCACVHLPWTRVPCTFTVIFILPNVRQLIADPKK